MTQLFSKKTFKFFKDAYGNIRDPEWFDENKEFYLEHVKGPFSEFVEILNAEIGDELVGISVSPRSISRPKRPSNKQMLKGINKDFIAINIAQKKSSIFETNPTIHIQLGHQKEDNRVGMGLYMVSSRQIKKMRVALVEDFDTFRKIVNKKAFREHWGEILGEKYKRLPVGMPEDHKGLEYFFYKQFYISCHLTQKEVIDPHFTKNMVKKIKAGLPLFHWLRKSVGVYK